MPRGDDLERMQRDLATAPRRMMGAAASAARSSLRQSVDTGYRESVDVDGKPYLRPKDGHMPPMERTGKLRNAYRYLVTEGIGAYLVTIIERTDYGKYLRDGTHGTRKMEPRQHIPKPDQPLPAHWYARMSSAIGAAVARVMS